MKAVKDLTTLKAIGKKYNLTFCRTHKYCESGPYLNDVGEPIPNYFYHKRVVYKLQYVDGCFNPFLVVVELTNDAAGDHIRRHVNEHEGREVFFIP
jgi:hypothetical protein